MLAGILALAAATLVAAAERQDGPGIPFEDALAGKLEGRWKVVRNVRGKEMASTTEVAWVCWAMQLENADKAGKCTPFATERWERAR